MIDVKKLVRTAFFRALSGNLTSAAAGAVNPLPVSDDMKTPGNTSSVYVILGTQTGAPRNNFTSWASDETIDIDIVYKTGITSGKLTLDLVAGQIVELICPSVGTNGLPPQPGIQILNVVLHADRYLTLSLNQSNTVERRILTFKMYVGQI